MNEVMNPSDMLGLMQQATMNISTLGEQMGIVKKSLGSLNTRVSDLEERQQMYEDHIRLTRH